MDEMRQGKSQKIFIRRCRAFPTRQKKIQLPLIHMSFLRYCLVPTEFVTTDFLLHCLHFKSSLPFFFFYYFALASIDILYGKGELFVLFLLLPDFLILFFFCLSIFLNIGNPGFYSLCITETFIHQKKGITGNSHNTMVSLSTATAAL